MFIIIISEKFKAKTKIFLPATSVRSQTPSIRSVIKTAAVTNVAKKKTILQQQIEIKKRSTVINVMLTSS